MASKLGLALLVGALGGCAGQNSNIRLDSYECVGDGVRDEYSGEYPLEACDTNRDKILDRLTLDPRVLSIPDCRPASRTYFRNGRTADGFYCPVGENIWDRFQKGFDERTLPRFTRFD